jgi:hypothetical protein
MRLAYFTPLPPSKSGIADYNSEILPYQAMGVEISVFVAEADELSGNHDSRDFSVHGANDFDEIHARRPYDLCVYHLGANPYHENPVLMPRKIKASLGAHRFQRAVVWKGVLIGIIRLRRRPARV